MHTEKTWHEAVPTSGCALKQLCSTESMFVNIIELLLAEKNKQTTRREPQACNAAAATQSQESISVTTDAVLEV